MKIAKVKLEEEDFGLGVRILNHPAWAGDHGFEGAQLRAWKRLRTWYFNKIAKILKGGPRKDDRKALEYWQSCHVPKCPQHVPPRKGGTASGKSITYAARLWIMGEALSPLTRLEWSTAQFSFENEYECRSQTEEAGDHEPD